MNTKVMLTFAVIFLSLQAQAGERRLAAGWQEDAVRMAQLSEQERRRMRQEWQSMEPDDRSRLRQEFQDRLQALPPEEREQRRREIMERWRERTQERGDAGQARSWRDEDAGPGFGRGYERREMQRGGGRGR